MDSSLPIIYKPKTLKIYLNHYFFQETFALSLSLNGFKRRLLLGRKVMTNLDSIFKSRDITLPTKVHLVKAMVFPVVMYRCESWTVKKAEHWRTDAFELWCWRRLLRVPWTARRSNQSILKEISPGISLEGMMLYFTSMWDEYNCVVVWAFFGIAFLWDWDGNWPFPVLWPLLSFPNLLAYWVQPFHSIIFQDLK